MNQSPILVIGPSWVGDMMMSHSLYRTLKQQQPQARLDVLAPAWCAPLLARMPEVDNALTLPIAHRELALKKRYQLGKSLAKTGYQQAYILPNSFKSALLPFWANIPHRTGWQGEIRYGLLNDRRKLDKQALPLMVLRYVALAYPANTPLTVADILLPQLTVSPAEIATLYQHYQLAEQRYIAFCPGAEFGPAKRWPHYHYAQLAQQLISQGYAILLLGSNNDKSACQAIYQALPHHQQKACHLLAGKTSLDQATVLLAGSQAVISNDSGLMHVAAALQRPLVALYGPSSPDFTPPLHSKACIIRLIDGYQRIRRGDQQQGYHQSLIDITPDRVLQALTPLLAS